MGQRAFATIDFNLREIATGENRNKSFGGWSVILFGDFTQLPPVKDSALYKVPVWNDTSESEKTIKKAFNLWNNEFTKAVCLSQVRRTEPTEGGRQWKKVTDELFAFNLSKESIKIIESRRWGNLSKA